MKSKYIKRILKIFFLSSRIVWRARDSRQVVSRALELLFVCCSAVQTFEEQATDTYTSMLAAATAAAHAHDERPFEVVVRHLSSGELEVRLNALTLLNRLLASTSRWVDAQRLVYALDQLGANGQVVAARCESDRACAHGRRRELCPGSHLR